jgi:hypothetical protein
MIAQRGRQSRKCGRARFHLDDANKECGRRNN